MYKFKYKAVYAAAADFEILNCTRIYPDIYGINIRDKGKLQKTFAKHSLDARFLHGVRFFF